MEIVLTTGINTVCGTVVAAEMQYNRLFKVLGFVLK